MNPRYIVFAKFNGNTPEQQQIDKSKALSTFDFTMFIHEQKKLFANLFPNCLFAGRIINHNQFDEYLNNL